MIYKLLCTTFNSIAFAALFWISGEGAFAQNSGELNRNDYLKELQELNRPHPTPAQRPRNVYASFVRLSYQDSTWDAWQQRTGELPPIFDQMPDLPYLPNPMIWDEGGQNIPITTTAQWNQKRNWIQGQVKELLSGTFPDPPQDLTSSVLEERMENDVLIQRIMLKWGSHEKAKLTLEVYTPPGDGPFPVFLTQWNHRGWVQVAVRRGYMGVIYAGADDLDDTIHYQEVYPGYDWTALMTRAWGAMRAVDYLYELPQVDNRKIALTGHSRNAKLSLFAAAFDSRIAAVISSSGGTGGEIPYRYTDERHENESIDYLNSIRPQWFHPRLRFYNGREHKIPIDQNSLMALIAPNSLLLSSSIREAGGGDPWAIEQNFKSLKQVYSTFGVSGKVGLLFRDGGHSLSARDIESYVDWLDIQFNRKNLPWQDKTYYDFDFELWKGNLSSLPNLEDFPVKNLNGGMNAMVSSGNLSATQWTSKKEVIRNHLTWVLGETPPGILARPIEEISNKADYMDQLIQRPEPKNGARKNIAPYNALGDYQHGAIYYPTDQSGQLKLPASGKLPIVIWSHKFVNTGFDAGLTPLIQDFLEKGVAVMVMDLLGYGSRIEEGSLFYDRYPEWSKMGKMVQDTRAAIHALKDLDFVDSDQVFLGGYALGGTVSLLTAALEDQVAGVAVSAAFTPWRAWTADASYEGNRGLAHQYGLIPKLGLFEGQEARIPVDFAEILSIIVPKPLLVISPSLDRHADFAAVTANVSTAKSVYQAWSALDNISHYTPKSYNRFTRDQHLMLVNWVSEQTNLHK
ncbi:alpha/beta fold hydrolase [Lunatibacter salilacus]|uniref:alpha/beta fold hydrolase n=1 Tax=Lunatibacter salilacus TaxID=2483804 RepID=UPI00131AE128|nr:alpha/beta fold hydrolase [Lunatibacter salilacus]